MNSRSHGRRVIIAVVAAYLLVIAISFIVNNFMLSIAIMIAVYALWGISWNLVGGYAGQISLGHSIFISLGVYTTIILLNRMDMPVILGWILGCVVAAVAALIIGGFSFRLKGAYFTLATISFNALLLEIILHFKGLTGGPNGLTVTFSRTNLLNLEFVNLRSYYWIAVTLVFVLTIAVSYIKESRFGFALRALGNSPEAAEAVGINVYMTKLTALVFSAAIASLGGVIYVLYQGFADPNYLSSTNLSVQIAMVAAVGGTAYVVGPILGSVLIVGISNLANAVSGSNGGLELILYGMLLMIVLLVQPQGLTKMVLDLWDLLIGTIYPRKEGGSRAGGVDRNG